MGDIFSSTDLFFRNLGSEGYAIQFSRFRRDALVLIQKQVDILEDGDTLRVYAIGGEEILFDCLNGIVGMPGVELAMIPFNCSVSFLNNFGKDAAVQFESIPALINGTPIPTDVISTNISYALNACFIGYTRAASDRMLESSGKSVIGRAQSFYNYLYSGINKRLFTQPYGVTIDDADYSGRYSLIIAANGPFYDGDKITSSAAVPNDGLLDIMLFRPAGALKVISMIRQAAQGEVPAGCTVIQAKKVSIESKESMWIQADSEIYRDTRVVLEVLPGALQFVTLDNLAHKKI
jgi:diacylglycerol kinase family enzyme